MPAGDSAGAPFDFTEARTASFPWLLRRSGPKLARDGMVPALVFYVAWRFAGLWAGIGCAGAYSLINWLRQRRHEQSGTVAGLSLLFLGLHAFQALMGLLTGSVSVYLALGVIASGVTGLVFVASVVLRRPLAGVIGLEVYPFPPIVQASATFQRVFGHISLAWGAYLVVRCAARLVALSTGHIEFFLLFTFLTGTPATALLMSWSLWYGVHSFRHSAEWGGMPRLAA